MQSNLIKYILSVIIFISVFDLACFAYASLLNENTTPPMKLLTNTTNELSHDERLDVAKKLINKYPVNQSPGSTKRFLSTLNGSKASCSASEWQEGILLSTYLKYL